ncbi:hypothetical protein HK405_014197, partial [Cladochytrium tenue]
HNHSRNSLNRAPGALSSTMVATLSPPPVLPAVAPAAAALSPAAPAVLAAVLAAASAAVRFRARRADASRRGLAQLVLLLRTVAGALAYVTAVRFLRRRHLLRSLATGPGARFVAASGQGRRPPAPLADMTPEEARGITRGIFVPQFGALVLVADQLALLKTYAVPTISSLLARTRQLCSGLCTPRRVADTSVLLSEAIEHPFEHPRSATAVARINWLHAHYRKYISNKDMIYTLALFITEPLTWVGRYGWRRITDVERHALGLTFIELARRMGIRDFPDSVDGVFAFARDLEADPTHFYFHEDNLRVAGSTFDLLLSKIPFAAARDQVKRVVVAGLDPHLVRTLGIKEAPNQVHHAVFQALMRVQAAVIANLVPPIFDAESVMLEPLPAGLDPVQSLSVRRFMRENTASSIYVRPSLWNRWLSPISLLSRIANQPLPGSSIPYGEAADQANVEVAHLEVYSTNPKGFLLEEAGPAAFVGKGVEEVRLNAAELQR